MMASGVHYPIPGSSFRHSDLWSSGRSLRPEAGLHVRDHHGNGIRGGQW